MARTTMSKFDTVSSVWPISEWIVNRVNTGSNASVTSEGGLAASYSANPMHMYRRHAPNASQVGVLAKMRRTNITATRRDWIVVRSSGVIDPNAAERPTSGIGVNINNDGRLELFKIVNGVFTSITTLTKATGTGFWWYRFEAIGGLRVKAWADGTSEPGTWDITQSDDGTVPAGGFELISYKNTTSAGDAIWSYVETYAPAGTAAVEPAPMIFRTLDGATVRHGRSLRKRADECFDTTQPTWLTGTTAFDSATLRRSITAAAAGSATLTAPSLTVDAHSRVDFGLEQARLSAETLTTVAIQLVGTSTYALTSTPAGGLVLSGPGRSSTLLTDWIGASARNTAGEGMRPHNYSITLLPKYGQLIAFQGEKVIGWLDFGAPITGSFTPTISLSTTDTAAKTLSYGRLFQNVDSL